MPVKHGSVAANSEADMRICWQGTSRQRRSDVDLAWVGDFFMPAWRNFSSRHNARDSHSHSHGRCPFGVSWIEFWGSDGPINYTSIAWKCRTCGYEMYPGDPLLMSHYYLPGSNREIMVCGCSSDTTGRSSPVDMRTWPVSDFVRLR